MQSTSKKKFICERKIFCATCGALTQPRCNIVKDEKGDLVADSHSIVARWRNYFSQLFNVHGVKDVGQAEIQQNHLYLNQVPLSLSWLLTG